jgi:glycosyltransferase involved in cell wall biosynthesis
VVEVDPAREAVAKVLEKHGAAALVSRLMTVASPVGEMFTTPPVPAERERLVVAVGRWDLAQKDAPLLAAALERFLAVHPGWRAVVVGRCGEEMFRDRDRIAYFGRLPQEQMAPLLGRARVFVSSSRWESFCLAAHESLAMGCSVAGPPLAAFADIASRGPYGTAAEGRSAAALAAALQAEAAAWDRGERNPAATAGFWRHRVSVDGVAERMADLLS